MQQQPQILRPETLVEEFKKNGVTHIITIPDSETNYLYELMLEQDWLDVVPVSREGETMSIALGLNVAGKVPVCLIQNTGMMESGDSIRGMALDTGFPLVMVVGYRGWTRLGQDAGHCGDLHGAVPARVPHQLLSGGAR
ncbi:Sulfopyruvate decarboxylase subunit alpha [Geodia barretti]|uniref:Sulfopyruvate decarboxylase subunit alpha n=1 Tax=Geodia barretti TaxID=519541 RepID=A0AA35TVN1_GEOBA|nr:Sulfopyruvate decarboxylase subunit alpha [Geodia barretti]